MYILIELVFLAESLAPEMKYLEEALKPTTPGPQLRGVTNTDKFTYKGSFKRTVSYPSPSPSNQGSHSDWKTWKNGKAFSSQGKSGNFDQTGKVRKITQILEN